MSNSPLVVHTNLSPNCTKPRNAKIDTITIHCMAGNCSIETCGRVFAPTSRQASSNYGVGTDGRIGLYVDEANRSWCTSSGANDNRSVTIEVANDENKEPWHVSDKALAATIELVTDICKRNGIKKLLWQGDKNLIGQADKQNMTVHRWFAAKSCPGNYLFSKHSYIADEVNKRLGSAPIAPAEPTVKGTAILGAVAVGAEVMAAFLLSKNTAPKLNGVDALGLAKLYTSEGATEGVRGDIAFCQSCVETGYWKFGNDVKPEQNNFAGIGAVGGGASGAAFPTVQIGIRAQIQHLKAYATAEPLKTACVDPRYSLVSPKGKAPAWEGLSGTWAADKTYGAKILSVYDALRNFKASAPSQGYEVGDIVQFSGGAVYTSANAAIPAHSRGKSRCKVTQICNGKHPLHLVSADTGGVYGWVDTIDIAAGISAGTIAVGSKVKIKADAKYYSGGAIPAWVAADTWIVSGLSGDRAVLGKNVSGKSNINSPINISGLVLV